MSDDRATANDSGYWRKIVYSIIMVNGQECLPRKFLIMTMSEIVFTCTTKIENDYNNELQ